MNRIAQIMIFLTIVLIVYFGMHYYVFWRLSGMLGFTKSYAILAVLTVSYPLAALLEKTAHNFITRIFYALSSVWVGILFFLFSALIIYEVVRLFNPDARTAGILIIAIVCVLTIISIANALFVNIRHIEMTVEGLETPLEIVHLSDIHVGTIRNSRYLSKIVEKTNALDPDMVFITGDLFDGSAPLRNDTIRPLDDINAKTFFTFGNHENYEGEQKVMDLLSNTKMQILRNQMTSYKGLQIVGVDDPEFANVSFDSYKLDDSKPSILLIHRPVMTGQASRKGFDVMLSGHTHNGQIIPFNLFVRMAFRYVKGLYNHDGMHIYVTPGTGTWGPPMRLGSRNEITHISLRGS